MKDIIGLHAYKKDGVFANRLGVIELNDSEEFVYRLRFKTGEVAGFNSIDEIKIIELGR